MNACIFCKIIKKEIPADFIYEDEYVAAFLDIHPINIGHTLVVSKKHFDDFISTPDYIAQKLILTIKKITPIILKAMKANACNISTNNGKESGQVIEHVHFHIIPRFSDDNFIHWQGREVAAEELGKAAEKIRKEIQKL